MIRSHVILTNAVFPAEKLLLSVLHERERGSKGTLTKCIEDLEPIAGGTTDGASWCQDFDGEWDELLELAHKTLFAAADPSQLIDATENLQQACVGLSESGVGKLI